MWDTVLDADELLTSVSTSARTIAWALESTMRRAGQSQRARTLRVGPRRPLMKPLGHGLFQHDGAAGRDQRTAIRVNRSASPRY